MSDAVVQIEDLTRTFGATVAVDGLKLTVRRGEVFGFLGRNGAGKTTTIKTLLGLLRPTNGTIRVLGLDPVGHGSDLKQRIGYVSEMPQLYPWMRVREMVRFTRSFYQHWNDVHVARLLEQFRLDPECKVQNLSRGMGAQLALVDSGGGNYVEIFAGGAGGDIPQGHCEHFAFRTDDCDAALAAAVAAGAEVTMAAKSLTIEARPTPVPVRIAFVRTPTGQIVEFFQNELT